MKHCMLVLGCFAAFAADANPAIDMEGYLRVSREAVAHRDTRRVSEEDFTRMSRRAGHRDPGRAQPGEIRRAARQGRDPPELSGHRCREPRESTTPDKPTGILIYCNNNFASAPGPFPAKIARAALNLSTYIALYSYGYRNVYELAPLIDLKASRLEFEALPD